MSEYGDLSQRTSSTLLERDWQSELGILQTSPVSLSGIIGIRMNQQDREADERVRQLCLKAAAANSDEELESTLTELRGAIRDSMSRARERLENLAILESHLKPAA